MYMIFYIHCFSKLNTNLFSNVATKIILVNMLKNFLDSQPNGIHFEWRGVRYINNKVILFKVFYFLIEAQPMFKFFS